MVQNASPRIVIIGAGVAGIAAATSLLDRGFDNIKIIEAENRIGGRIHTVRFGRRHVDLGAHWIHGEVDNIVYGLGNQMGLITNSWDFGNVSFVTDDGRSIAQDIGMTLFAQAGNLLEDDAELKRCKGSLEDFWLPKCREISAELIKDETILEGFLKWLKLFECTVEGCDRLSDVSAQGHTSYKQCDGDPILNWKNGGYYNIIDILLRRHPNCVGVPISLVDRLILNTEVLEIDWNGLTALIKCTNGKLFKADRVIVTVSLGVLKEKYRTLFNPALPMEKIRAILGLGIGTVDKIYIRFAHQWWPEDSSGFSLLRTKELPIDEENLWENQIIGFYKESSTDPTVLTAWLIGQGARDMEIYSNDEVLVTCHRVLVKFLGDQYDIPLPEEIVRSKWYSNSHFRGSYSFRTINSEVLNTSADILAKPLQNEYNIEMILFAGEATHSYFYSTVHGALETGWREAKRIADHYTPSPELRKCNL